jgi:hypothetical protein
MKNKRLDINSIPAEELSPLVRLLIQEILYLREENQKLKDEIAILKKGRPQR